MSNKEKFINFNLNTENYGGVEQIVDKKKYDTLSKKGSSLNDKFEFFAKTSKKKESINIHVIFLGIIIFQTVVMIGYGSMLLYKNFRRKA